MTDLKIDPFSVGEGVPSITADAATQATLPPGIHRSDLSDALEIEAQIPSGA